ncbi:micrococcal nuclease [Scopulibacillus darangshiensis]|uniref:Micrococcal nuclease n=1 Tax=Scopulibacillus darangshiensis TaxID=442528 RepID=A0A4R2NB88_9BACL|nr:thermonuclease family protein [Scopulibacillus darangshiensis]TCP18320.1 micrococcal nuclease [Scopulibacillus darangshiensis]
MISFITKVLLILTVIASITGCSELQTGSSENTTDASTQHTAISGKHLVTAKVSRVVDGDTIKVDYKGREEAVRFLLVDTPETHHPRLGVQPFGPEASQFTHKLLDGQTVQMELAVSGGRDKYGRMLAYLYINGKSVEEELLKRGLARVAYVYPPNTKYVDEYRAVQKKAQARGVGIWSVEDYARKDGYHPEALEAKQEGAKKEAAGGSFEPDKSGNCSGEIKGNVSGNGAKIYHLPSDRYYKITKAEKCFNTATEAKKAGFRAPRTR